MKINKLDLLWFLIHFEGVGDTNFDLEVDR